MLAKCQEEKTEVILCGTEPNFYACLSSGGSKKASLKVEVTNGELLPFPCLSSDRTHTHKHTHTSTHRKWVLLVTIRDEWRRSPSK